MEIITPGHLYKLSQLDGSDSEELRFVKRTGNELWPGTINQEVIRALIDRVIFLDNQVPWSKNDEILYHLRMALVLHETRALERKVEKGELLPENVKLNSDDGHFKLESKK